MYFSFSAFSEEVMLKYVSVLWSTGTWYSNGIIIWMYFSELSCTCWTDYSNACICILKYTLYSVVIVISRKFVVMNKGNRKTIQFQMCTTFTAFCSFQEELFVGKRLVALTQQCYWHVWQLWRKVHVCTCRCNYLFSRLRQPPKHTLLTLVGHR